ncbi:MAG: retroviral-like aspartic protease family protein [Chitinophagaceae bacterium]|nr:retroviral-like aspartic protease family protein [Chitinophagaceae bacterium]
MQKKVYTILIQLYGMLCTIGLAAQPGIDTLLYTMPQGLIVIEGKINGQRVPMVFDTGAGLSVSNDSVNNTADIKNIKSTINVRDANEQKTSTPMVKVNRLRIGRFEAKNLKVISFDMPFLACHGSLLLGQDYIAQYNWKFDFEKKKVMLSATPFVPENEAQKLPVVLLKNKRPFLTMKLQGNEASQWLIDFGYRGYMDIEKNMHGGVTFNPSYPKAVFEAQTMGLLGSAQKDNLIKTQIDDLQVGNMQLNGIPADLDSGASAKVGLYFFNDLCNTMILNHTTGEYYVTWKQKPTLSLGFFDASPSWEAGKLVISTRRTDSLSTVAHMPPNMVVEKVNGLSATTFGSNCSWLSWRLGFSGQTYTLQGSNGKNYTIGKIPYAEPFIKQQK